MRLYTPSPAGRRSGRIYLAAARACELLRVSTLLARICSLPALLFVLSPRVLIFALLAVDGLYCTFFVASPKKLGVQLGGHSKATLGRVPKDLIKDILNATET